MVLAEYQQHMNTILAPFLTRSDNCSHFMINNNGHRYEVFMDETFENGGTSKDMGEKARRFETTIGCNCIAYLMGEDLNSSQPHIVHRESAVELIITKETVMMRDKVDWENGGYSFQVQVPWNNVA
jgi:hypothetical protein